jgi:hypothetical protein
MKKLIPTCIVIGLTALISTAAMIRWQLSYAQEEKCTPFSPTDLKNPAGDGIPSNWKTNGIPFTNSLGMLDHYMLPGANPLHKDLYVEIDYMQFHKPMHQAISDVVKAFADAPVCNPDGTTGINLHVLVDEQIPLQDVIKIDCFPGGDWSGFNSLKKSFFGTSSERHDPNELAAKSLVYHYGIFINEYSSMVDSSGCSDPPNMNFVISLGFRDPNSGRGWGLDPETGRVVGSLSEQEGTFMHEFGHTLGLHHGGMDDVNYKPNYFSIMNYLFQFPFYVANRSLSYSNCALGTINENHLDEEKGLTTNGCPHGQNTTYIIGTNSGPMRISAPNDWDNSFGDSNNKPDVSSDLNGDGSNDKLTGYDDWSHIIYIMNSSRTGGSATPGFPTQSNHPDMTVGDIRKARLSLLTNIQQSISSLPPSAFASPSVTHTLSPRMGLTPVGSLSPKKIFENFLGVGNGTVPLVRTTISPSLVNTTSGSVAPIITISSNLNNDKLNEAIGQLDTLKIMVAGTSGANRTISGGAIAPTIGLIINSTAQKDILSKINNLEETIKLQQ